MCQEGISGSLRSRAHCPYLCCKSTHQCLGKKRIEKQRKRKKSVLFGGCDETIRLILRTIIFVNQLSVYGAAADLCKELARDSSSARKPAENENLGSVVIPTEFPTANTISHTDADVQGNLLREYEQKFQELPEQQKLTELCANAGFSKNCGKRPFFLTLDEEGPDEMKTSCREYTLPRSEEASRVRVWILGNTKIGRVLDVMVCFHQGRYGVEIMIESCFETEQFLRFES